MPHPASRPRLAAASLLLLLLAALPAPALLTIPLPLKRIIADEQLIFAAVVDWPSVAPLSWYIGISIPSSARFFCTIETTGGIAHTTIACGARPRILVSWGFMSVSVPPNFSQATTSMPAGPAAFWNSSRPVSP